MACQSPPAICGQDCNPGHCLKVIRQLYRECTALFGVTFSDETSLSLGRLLVYMMHYPSHQACLWLSSGDRASLLDLLMQQLPLSPLTAIW